MNAPDGTPLAYVAPLSRLRRAGGPSGAHDRGGQRAQDNLLRMSQAAPAAIACMGTVAVIYLLYLRIILPVPTLQDGLRRMADRDYSLRLPAKQSRRIRAH